MGEVPWSCSGASGERAGNGQGGGGVIGEALIYIGAAVYRTDEFFLGVCVGVVAGWVRWRLPGLWK